jgi:hypothetical protein
MTATQAKSTSAKLAATLLASALALTLSAGCGRRPAFEYGSQGTPIMEKRIARFPEVNYATRFCSTAYVRNSWGWAKAKTEEQTKILEEHGQPDYTRKSFRTTRGDTAWEWAYLEKNKVFQFVGRQLVYEGPLSDKDRVLMQWGYPDHVLLQNDLLGARRETFIYTAALDSHVKYFSFADDNMVLGVESH